MLIRNEDKPLFTCIPVPLSAYKEQGINSFVRAFRSSTLKGRRSLQWLACACCGEKSLTLVLGIISLYRIQCWKHARSYHNLQYLLESIFFIDILLKNLDWVRSIFLIWLCCNISDMFYLFIFILCCKILCQISRGTDSSLKLYIIVLPMVLLDKDKKIHSVTALVGLG